ncbi:MAG: serine protease [Chloroflexi bacterium]|nr:MAG: serine protease [Chloroflexota bacterium]
MKSILAFIGVVAILSLSCTLTEFLPTDEGSSGAATVETGPTLERSPRGVEEMVKATVQILAMVNDQGEWVPIWSGSGSLISEDGLILTNNHVIDTSFFEYDALGVAITNRSDQPPILTYLAVVMARDPVLDLAVIRIDSDLQGNAVSSKFSFMDLADSDQVEIGDSLQIWGYPGIGGETITFTQGAVSGFTLERGINGRAWIKTDATIAGGNSGGMGTNEDGDLIGVPTIVTSGSETGQAVDCRPLADTDRDGDIDSDDSCVPVGGFINALRPANLALPLIEAVIQGREYAEGSGAQSQENYDSSSARFLNLLFSDGVTGDDQPTQLWYALPSESTQICAFWDYEGMANGVAWSSYWFFNGELNEGGSTLDQAWGGGEAGNWWVCLVDDTGLAEGVYEVALEIEGTVLATDAVFVGGERGAAEFALENRSSSPICVVNLSPSGATNWGQNKLDSGDVVQPSEIRLIALATGEYDIRLVGCNDQSLRELFGVEISEDHYLGFED